MKLLFNLLISFFLMISTINAWSANWVIIKKASENNEPLIQVDLDTLKKTPAGNTQATVSFSYNKPKDFFGLANPVQSVALDGLFTCLNKEPYIKKMTVTLFKNKKDRLATLDAQAEKIIFLNEAQTKDIVDGVCLISRYSIKRKN